MDIDTLLRYISQQSDNSATGAALHGRELHSRLEWREREADARPASATSSICRGTEGYPRRTRHATKEDQGVIDLRNRWQIEK